MEIQKIVLATDESPSEFERKLEKTILTMQNEGLQVTVQFSTSTVVVSNHHRHHRHFAVVSEDN